MNQLTLNEIRTLCGYVEDGSDTRFSIHQDDATRTWIVTVGKNQYYGESFMQAINNAVKENSDEAE